MLVGVCHGRCARTVVGGIERRVLDVANTRSLIRLGHESSVGSVGDNLQPHVPSLM